MYVHTVRRAFQAQNEISIAKVNCLTHFYAAVSSYPLQIALPLIMCIHSGANEWI